MFTAGNWLQVPGIKTGFVLTQMMEFLAFRYWSDEHFIKEYVSLLMKLAAPQMTIAISGYMARPDPANIIIGSVSKQPNVASWSKTTEFSSLHKVARTETLTR
jgi:hypothetical protein